LITLLQDDDDYVKILAVDSLLELNRPRLRQIWIDALNSENCYVSEVATKALALFRCVNTSKPVKITPSVYVNNKNYQAHAAVLAILNR
jgi:HEAT repeat protein